MKRRNRVFRENRWESWCFSPNNTSNIRPFYMLIWQPWTIETTISMALNWTACNGVDTNMFCNSSHISV